jgi:hypothetical protein
MPAFDGIASPGEVRGRRASEDRDRPGGVTVWVVRSGDTVTIAARLADSTFYWGDDFVISLDPLGDRTPDRGMTTRSGISAGCSTAAW